MKRYTVIGLYEDTGQVFFGIVETNSPYMAMQAVANRPESQMLVILGAIAGEHNIVPACDESGNAAFASDMRC